MAYLKLRYYLQSKRISLRVVAAETGINLNRIYNITGRSGIDKFTPEEIELIWNSFLKDSGKSKEELFEYETYDPKEKLPYTGRVRR